MAEITKVTTPMIPQENLGKNRPISEQAFELNNPQKVHKPEERNISDRETGQALKDAMGRAAVAPLLREAGDLVHAVQRMVAVFQMGLATSDIVTTDPMRTLLETIFADPHQLLDLLMQQEEAATIFSGETFDMMRDVADRFYDQIPVRNALSGLLKAFEHNVNLENSTKTILYNCRNILDYMFSKDREQFSNYLTGLREMLLPTPEELEAQTRQQVDEQGNPIPQADQQPAQQMEPREAAQLLKNNLLPLLGEIVVKYYQNESIRDIVMVVVHNIVRVDRGTPEAMREALQSFTHELSLVANLPPNFEQNLFEALMREAEHAKGTQNEVVDKLARVISHTLHNEDANPAALRQAENLLMSMLQNESSMMNILHFLLPMQTPEGLTYTEMYVDPEAEERKPKGGTEQGRKIFLSVESEQHGTMELSFFQVGERVDFSMWLPPALVGPLSKMRRPLSDIMGVHGFQMGGYTVDEFVQPHSIVQVFPKLLDRKVGIDVRV